MKRMTRTLAFFETKFFDGKTKLLLCSATMIQAILDGKGTNIRFEKPKL